MPTCDTRYFGPTAYSDDSLIHMPRGPIGFEDETAFVLIQLPEQFPLVYLQSTRSPHLCFIALPVLTIARDYKLVLHPEDAETIDVPFEPEIGRDVLCLVLIATGEDGPTANLLAPVLVNLRTRRAMQCINANGESSVRHPICTAAEGVAA
jgi:flagellar assembly factor FliW